MAPKRCLEPGCPRYAIPGYSRCAPHQRVRWATYNDPAYRTWPRDRACQKCGATDDLTRDHIIPVSRGGTNDPTNLRTLCRPCNSSRKDLDEFERDRREYRPSDPPIVKRTDAQRQEEGDGMSPADRVMRFLVDHEPDTDDVA